MGGAIQSLLQDPQRAAGYSTYRYSYALPAGYGCRGVTQSKSRAAPSVSAGTQVAGITTHLIAGEHGDCAEAGIQAPVYRSTRQYRALEPWPVTSGTRCRAPSGIIRMQ